MTSGQFENKAIDRLLGLIGQPVKAGEWYPLEKTWHAERAMWIAKVESLIEEVARLQRKINGQSSD